MIPRAQQMVAIFWPSFLLAGLGVIVMFTAIDPQEIVDPNWFANLNRLEAYTVGFLFLWLLTSMACMLTCYFQKPEDRVCVKT